MTRAKGQYIDLVSQFGHNPCPVCGKDRKWYIRTTRRGPNTKKGGHRPGEKRTRRQLRATCGKQRCQNILRGRSLAGGN